MNVREATHVAWDVIVVGAGPAGAVAARQIAGAGMRVLLVDKAPLGRRKVCGCCLNATALGMLEAISLGDIPQRHGAIPLERLQINAPRAHATLRLPGGVSLSREVFDAALIQAAVSSGAVYWDNTHAALGSCYPHHREVLLSKGTRSFTVAAKLVLGADGLGSTLIARRPHGHDRIRPNSRIGAGVALPTAPAYFERGTVYMACGRAGYVGLVVLEDGRINIAAAFDLEMVRSAGGPGPLASRIIAEVGWPIIAELPAAPWQGTPALSRQAVCLADRRVLLLGDAAGFVEPFTGEGMAWALAGAIAVTPLAVRAATCWTDDIGDEWANRYHTTIVSRQQICRRVAWGLRHPMVVHSAIKFLDAYPSLAQKVINRVNDVPPLPQGKLACR